LRADQIDDFMFESLAKVRNPDLQLLLRQDLKE